MPKVSVVMSIYNGRKYIEECIESIINQTFTDWEFIIVNEFGYDDGSAEIIKKYAEKDKRIRFIQNNERLGLAESLNVGISTAKGEYIARVDDDDPSYPMRFEKQVDFMDKNPDVSICGTLQRSVSPNGTHVEYVPCNSEELKAGLLFGCEISHCSVMLRKKDFDNNNWQYDNTYLGEDFELWTRIMNKAKFVNLNEVLVDHRWGYDNISLAKGESLRQEVREINARTLKLLDIDMTDKDIMLLSGWRNRPEEHARKDISKFLKDGFELLELIEKQNNKYEIFDKKALKKILHKRWNWICQTCGLKFKEYEFDKFSDIKVTPKVSVIMPIYNSVKYLREAIDSVLDQTFIDWEFLCVNEYGSDDGAAEIIKAYSKYDSRIKLIQNDERLGLGDSLNKGFKMAKGEYLARLDADDMAHPTRFEKQVDLMDKNKNIGVCGTYQHHFGPGTDWVHMPPTTPEQCRANLLFYCDICHSTLMLRREVFIKNNLFYDNNYLAEDFELWTRAVAVTDFITIPEILGEYRWGEDNITLSKKDKLREESGHIVAKQLRQNLNMIIPEEDHFLFGGWDNLYEEETDLDKRRDLLERFKINLLNIWETNKKVKFYDNKSLLNIISAKWKWAMYNEAWSNPQDVMDIDEVFDPNYKPPFKFKLKRFLRNNPTMKLKIKKILRKSLKPLAHPFRRRLEALFNQAQDRICNHINDMTWDRYCKLERKIDNKVWQAEKRIIELQESLANQYFRNNLIPYKNEDKIKIVFVFQIASFWPSTESFYNECLNDDRFEVSIVCYDEDIDPSIKVDTARQYLIDNNMDFIDWKDFNLENYKPHVVVLQTAYDTNRCNKFTTVYLKSLGIRTIYIPYGIEIADTEHAHEAHFEVAVPKNCWRLYTFSERMLEDYKKYCDNAFAVRALGIPKFDNLYNKDKYKIKKEIREKANGRKIVLWKVHFPKVITENGRNILVTPYIEEYLKFAEMVTQYKDLFFIFMPHPRFKEFNDDETVKKQTLSLMDKISKIENVYIDDADDYRPSLVNSDYIIVDRSAVMIEAGAIGVPVLYMYNPDFYEPMTEGVKPLVDSYYQGDTCEDMVRFIEMIRKNQDPKKNEREAAFKKCIPYFDGKSGKRIKEDVVISIIRENEQLLKLNEYIVSDIQKNIDSSIQNTEKNIITKFDSRIWKAEQRQRGIIEENTLDVHRHIDITYRDIMVVLQRKLEFVGKHNLELKTKYPIAYKSNDYIVPHGTIRDNTRYPRFIKKCEMIFSDKDELSFLDLGCSGGGMVLDAALRGHLGIGLEGCDASLLEQRAEWRLLTNNLFTCDITKPYSVQNKNTGNIFKFDIITAWEVLEHIREEELEQFLINIRNHLSDNGLFVASIANWDDIDPVTGINWHVTTKPYEWWKNRFEIAGFEVCSEIIDLVDLARGGINHPLCYKAPSENGRKDDSFHIVVKIKK